MIHYLTIHQSAISCTFRSDSPLEPTPSFRVPALVFDHLAVGNPRFATNPGFRCSTLIHQIACNLRFFALLVSRNHSRPGLCNRGQFSLRSGGPNKPPDHQHPIDTKIMTNACQSAQGSRCTPSLLVQFGGLRLFSRISRYISKFRTIPELRKFFPCRSPVPGPPASVQVNIS